VASNIVVQILAWDFDIMLSSIAARAVGRNPTVFEALRGRAGFGFLRAYSPEPRGLQRRERVTLRFPLILFEIRAVLFQQLPQQERLGGVTMDGIMTREPANRSSCPPVLTAEEPT
jgi:hypothetical protein